MSVNVRVVLDVVVPDRAGASLFVTALRREVEDLVGAELRDVVWVDVDEPGMADCDPACAPAPDGGS